MAAEKPVRKQEGIQSVWTRPRTGREQPALSREQIVAEALRLLDEEGIDALSMRKLGARLGAGATSLYRKLGVATRADAIRKARSLGLDRQKDPQITPDSPVPHRGERGTG